MENPHHWNLMAHQNVRKQYNTHKMFQNDLFDESHMWRNRRDSPLALCHPPGGHVWFSSSSGWQKNGHCPAPVMNTSSSFKRPNSPVGIRSLLPPSKMGSLPHNGSKSRITQSPLWIELTSNRLSVFDHWYNSGIFWWIPHDRRDRSPLKRHLDPLQRSGNLRKLRDTLKHSVLRLKLPEESLIQGL
jgi:hypothetical protein